MNKFTIITNKVNLSNFFLKSSHDSSVHHRAWRYYFSHYRDEHVQSRQWEIFLSIK